VKSGELTVTVTDSTGQRRSTVLAIDPNRDSLRDVVSSLDGITGLRATVTSSGVVSLLAEPGYVFDFAGRPDQTPLTSTLTGTALPEISGTWLGPANATWQVDVLSSGEVGVTSGVMLRVTDTSTGDIVGDFNVGLGYPAGEGLEIADGVRISLSTGTLNAGESFQVRLTAEPDETGLLATLGLQSFFTGDSLRELQVHPDLAASPAGLAASRSGLPGEGRQLDRLMSLRNTLLFGDQTETAEDRLASMTGLSGLLAASRQLEVDQRDARQSQLETARAAISGVDPNEELLEMIQYQRAFQAASRFVSSVNQTLDDLLNLVGR
jgi:flagellar hook-associated protein 1